MSDSMRQSTTDKAASSMKPDSEKSVLEKGQETAKSTADSVAGSAQPEGEKSMGQQATDAVSGSGTGSGGQGQGVMGQAQEMAGNAAKSVQDTLGMGQRS
ncbi:hypothetical protein LTR37_008273 [Vermiconidia calcicola]|uniref:Uncharacterized protein n=1 Tax=Vermiconidia calcicola TaxID=1690605 RepID=A0ACC3NB68_9PEZI|nr:hypothetical protein LTR37_008273 [Vermiconidia calcicola]